MGLFTQNEIILMISVVSILLLCITILTIIDIKEYLKNKKESEKIVFGEKYEEEEKVSQPVEVMETNNDEILISDIEEEKPLNEDIFLEEIDDLPEEVIVNKQEEVKDNIEPQIIEEETVEPVVEKKVDLFAELDKAIGPVPNEKDDLTNFELEQERTAIISLDELLQKSDELYNDNEIVQYDDGDEPITIDEVISRYNKANNIVEEADVKKEVPTIMQDIVEEKKEPYTKKETIPFISSVYGIEKQNNALEFENTASYEKLDRAKSNEFMAKLREMNENK